jgi:hypothetical protein
MLGLQAKEDGQVVLISTELKRTQLHFKFFGHEFTKEDKDNLLKMEIWGEVDLTNPKQEQTIIISIDKLTNELIATSNNPH